MSTASVSTPKRLLGGPRFAVVTKAIVWTTCLAVILSGFVMPDLAGAQVTSNRRLFLEGGTCARTDGGGHSRSYSRFRNRSSFSTFDGRNRQGPSCADSTGQGIVLGHAIGQRWSSSLCHLSFQCRGRCAHPERYLARTEGRELQRPLGRRQQFRQFHRAL